MRSNGLGITLMILLFLVGNIFADTIYMKDGKLIKARISSEDEKTILIETDAEWKRIEKSDIQEIKKSEDGVVPEKTGIKKQKEGNPIGKGSLRISNGLSIHTTHNYNDNKATLGNIDDTIVGVSPSIGFFIAKGFLIGPEIRYLNVTASSNISTQFGYGLKAGKYFGKKNSSIYPHVGLSTFVTSYTYSSSPDASGSLVMPNIGMDIMLSRKSSIAIQINYSMETKKFNTDHYYGFNTSGNYHINDLELFTEFAVFCF